MIYRAGDTLRYAKSETLGDTLVDAEAEAVVGRLADPLPRAKCEALGHTLGHVEEEVKSARWLTR